MFRFTYLTYNFRFDFDRVRFGGALPADEMWRRYAAGHKGSQSSFYGAGDDHGRKVRYGSNGC